MKRGWVSLVRVGFPLPATSGIPGRPLWRMRMYESDG
jgi:hypothetical protein